jgi:hypothetical protein
MELAKAKAALERRLTELERCARRIALGERALRHAAFPRASHNKVFSARAL